jgi:transposase-like protein
MVTPGSIVCPRCQEDRPTMIHEVITAGVRVYVCMCCSFVMNQVEENAPNLSPEKLRHAVR